MDIDIDYSELNAVIKALEGSEKEVASKTYPVVKKHAEQLRDDWQKGARASSGRHGKHYPKSITASQLPIADAIEWEVGPEIRFKQGSMGRGFEYGSVNQAPHLDGNQAATKMEPLFLKSLEEIMKGIL